MVRAVSEFREERTMDPADFGGPCHRVAVSDMWGLGVSRGHECGPRRRGLVRVVSLNSRYTPVVTSERFGRCVVALAGF